MKSRKKIQALLTAVLKRVQLVNFVDRFEDEWRVQFCYFNFAIAAIAILTSEFY